MGNLRSAIPGFSNSLTKGANMKHLKPVNRKAGRLEQFVGQRQEAAEGDVVALQQPHIPLGCSQVFSPGWEVDDSGGTAGLCQPVERDLFVVA